MKKFFNRLFSKRTLIDLAISFPGVFILCALFRPNIWQFLLVMLVVQVYVMGRESMLTAFFKENGVSNADALQHEYYQA